MDGKRTHLMSKSTSDPAGFSVWWDSVEKEREFFCNRDSASLLNEAFSNLARLGNRLKVFIWSENSTEEAARLAQDRAFDYAHSFNLAFKYDTDFRRHVPISRYAIGIDDVLAALLQPILTTKARVTELHAPGCVIPHEVMFNENWGQNTTIFYRHLSSLSLQLASSHQPREERRDMDAYLRAFQDMFARTRLRHLSLHCDDQTKDDHPLDFWSNLENFLTNAVCPGLEEIVFNEGIDLPWISAEKISQLARFLYNHRATLKKVAFAIQIPDLDNHGGTWTCLDGANSAIAAIGRALAACQRLESLRMRLVDDCSDVFPEGYFSSVWAGSLIQGGQEIHSGRGGAEQYLLPPSYWKRGKRFNIICYDKHNGDGDMDQPTLAEFLQWMSTHADDDDDDDY